MPPTRSSSRQANTTASRSSGKPAVQRPSSTSNPSASTVSKQSFRITVKAPPSKLRQVAGSDEIPPNPYTRHSDTETPEPQVRSARSTRNPRTVVEADSDEGDEESDDVDGDHDNLMDEHDDDELEENIDAELLAAEDSGDGDEDAEGDLDMEEAHPPAPVVDHSTNLSGVITSRRKAEFSLPLERAHKSVEEKEAEEEGDLSDLQSDEDELGEDDDDDVDADDDDMEEGSRAGTPDLSKLTRRQRAAYDEGLDGSLMALSNEAQKKKHLTAEEHAMRRAEMARRRKNLSEKRNEEEKMDTINKLLKKPAPKRRTRAEIMAAAAAADGTPGIDDGDDESASALYVRWINNPRGSQVAVPAAWLDAPVGEILGTGWSGSTGRKSLIEEVS